MTDEKKKMEKIKFVSSKFDAVTYDTYDTCIVSL